MPTPAERVARIFEEAMGSELSSWEKFEFLPQIRDQSYPLTARQEKALAEIEARILDIDD